jgi:3-carboxy-cis,cis-muconate cycloisomerase
VEVLARDGDVSRHLTRAQLEKMCDPAAYLGLAGEMVDKVLARERAMDRFV